MKKLLIGLLAVVSLSGFAQSNTSVRYMDTTYPENTMNISCIDVECDFLSLGNDFIIPRSVTRKSVEVGRKLKREKVVLDEETFFLVKDIYRDAKKSFKEGYTGRGILKSAGIPFGMVMELTMILPLNLSKIGHKAIGNIGYTMSKGLYNAGLNIETAFEDDNDVIEVNHKHYIKQIDALKRMSFHSTQYNDFLLGHLISNEPSRCRVSLGTDSTLYLRIDGKFITAATTKQGTEELCEKLMDAINAGECSL